MQRFNKSKGSSSSSSRRCQSGDDPLDETMRAGRQSSLNATIVQRCSPSNNNGSKSPALSSSSLCDDVDDAALAHAATATAADHAALREANAENLQVIEDAVTTLAGMKRFERASRLAGTGEESNARPDAEGSAAATSGTMLRNSASMIELRELADIRAFDEAMQAIARASSPSATATAAKNIINNDKIADDNASAIVIVANEDNNDKNNNDDKNDNDNDNDEGGFFIGGADDDESPDFDTSYIIEEHLIPLNDVADDDDDHHHHVFSPLKRMHSLPADPNSVSGCSTKSLQTSFLPSCASMCEGNEQQAARRNSVEHNHIPHANDATRTITTAADDKTKQSSFPTKLIKKSASLLSLSSLGGRSDDGDDEKADASDSSASRKRSDSGLFIKSSLKKSVSMASLRGGRKSKNEEDELARSLGSSLHSFSSNHDPLARPTKSAMKRSTSLCALEHGNDSNRTLGTHDSTCSISENPDVQMKHSVSFHTMEIREYSVILGDNPSCSSGPPVQLAWNSHGSTELKIDDYEEHRPPRRDQAQMLMSYNVRWWSLMRESGYTVSQLKRATDACQEARKARQRTVRKIRRKEKINDTLTAPMRSLKNLTAS